MNLRRLGGILTLFFVLAGSASMAQDKGFGLGILLGDPTGVSAKLWTSRDNAVDFGLAWSFRRDGFIHIHADYLWHFDPPGNVRERFVFQAGVGGRLGAGKGSAVVGVRIPLILAWWPRSVPLDVFVELAPLLDLAPATEFSVNGGVGVRFFFQ